MNIVTRVAKRFVQFSAAVSSHYTTRYDRCPHCNEHTPWRLSILQGYSRCLRCGRDPLDPPAES